MACVETFSVPQLVVGLWGAYRAARCLKTAPSYSGDASEAAATAPYATPTAAGGMALAETLHGVVRPELVYAATTASTAMAGRHRGAVQHIKAAGEDVKTAVERALQGVKLAVERLYETVADTAARLLQMLREHWRTVALAAAAGLITRVVAQIDHTLSIEHGASLASLGFFGLGRVAEDKDKQRQLWKKTLEDWSLSATGEKVEAIKALLSERPIFAEGFEGLESVVSEEAVLRAWLIKKGVGELCWEPTDVKTPEVIVGPYLNSEELKAFGVREGVVGFLYKLHGEKKSVLRVGNVEAKELYAIVAKTGEKTIRVEVYAREVVRMNQQPNGGGGEFEAVDTPIGRLYRLASLSISTKPNGDPGTPTLNFTASVEREYRVGVVLCEEERKRAGLFGLIITDLGLEELKSPDLTEHAFLGLFANVKRMYIEGVALTDVGLSLQIVSEVKERFPPKVFFWEAVRGAVEKALEKALGSQRPKDLNQVLEALCGGPCVDEEGRPSAEPLLKVLREHFAELKELTAVARRKWRFYVRDDIDKVRINKRKGVAYVPRRMLFELLEAMKLPEFWLALLEGDGALDIYNRQLGLSVREGYEDVAALLLAALALRYGIRPRVTKRKRVTYLDAETSHIVSLLLLYELRQSPVVVLQEDELAKRLAEKGLFGVLTLITRRWLDWGMPGGRDPPKLITLLAFYERSLADLYAVYEKVKAGKVKRPWYFDLVEKILEEEGDAPFYIKEGILLTTAFDFRMKYLEREFRLDVEKAWREHPSVMSLVDRSYVLSAEYDERDASAVLMVPVEVGGAVRWQRVEVKTDWHIYKVSCPGQHCDKAREALGVKKHGGSYRIDAVIGRAILYTALRRIEHSLDIGRWQPGVKKWMKAPVRVELLEVRDNGDVKIRIWFYKWLYTRHHQPYVDVEIEFGDSKTGFIGWLDANEYEGIKRVDMTELYQLFTKEGLRVSGKRYNNEITGLLFYGGFRKELLRRVGYLPERVAANEPAAVKYLGGLRFEVEGLVVVFTRTESMKVPLLARLQFGTRDEAIDFYRRLKAAGVYADVKGNEVRLNDESFWGMIVASGVVPEDWQRIYPLEGDQYRDLYVFKRVDAEGVYYQFVVKVGGVWRAAGNWYDEKRQVVMLYHSDVAVLKAIREAAKRAVGAELGEVGEAKEGVYRLLFTRPVLEKFETRLLAAKPAEMPIVYVEGNSVVVKHGGMEHRLEFKLVKGREGVVVDSSLQPALKALGVPFTWTPEGAKLGRDGMWGLLATAVKDALRRGEQPTLPSGVSLITARPGRGHYIFRVDADDGQYVYSVLRVDGKWTAMGGKVRRDGLFTMQHFDEKVVKAHADAVNELLARCIDEGRCKKKEPKQDPRGKTWYFYLSETDLEELEKGLL